MQIDNKVLLQAAKQRIHELEDELLTYKMLCLQLLENKKESKVNESTDKSKEN